MAEKCRTAEEFRKISEELHECVENAIQDMCYDLDIEDYEPLY